MRKRRRERRSRGNPLLDGFVDTISMPTDCVELLDEIPIPYLLSTSQDYDLSQSIDLFCRRSSMICMVNVLLPGRRDFMNSGQKQRTLNGIFNNFGHADFCPRTPVSRYLSTDIRGSPTTKSHQKSRLVSLTESGDDGKQ